MSSSMSEPRSKHSYKSNTHLAACEPTCRQSPHVVAQYGRPDQTHCLVAQVVQDKLVLYPARHPAWGQDSSKTVVVNHTIVRRGYYAGVEDDNVSVPVVGK